MSENGRLTNWKEIAAYFSKSIATVKRWEKECGLPVHRYPGGGVYAKLSELEIWERTQKEVAHV